MRNHKTLVILSTQNTILRFLGFNCASKSTSIQVNCQWQFNSIQYLRIEFILTVDFIGHLKNGSRGPSLHFQN